MDWDMWAAVIGLATLIVALGGIAIGQSRATKKSHEAALKSLADDLGRRLDGQRAALDQMDAKNEAAHAGISERIDASRTEVLEQVRHLDAKNEAAHAGIEARVDRLGGKLDVVAHDVAFLAGRQKERDHQGGGGS